jgi:hypothetical protein
VQRSDAARWIGTFVELNGDLELVHERPWATVHTARSSAGKVWFKSCAEVQRFEPALTAALHSRRPEITPEVIAHDPDRAWLLLHDAGMPIGVYGNPPEAWLELLPRYAELQLGEVAHAAAHLASGVPDLRVETLAQKYDSLVAGALPLGEDERAWLLQFAPRLASLTAGLQMPSTVQHDDLHMANVYECDGRMRVLDWGDASVSHPFFSLFVTFRFLEEVTRLPAGDPWFARLSAAYLEPWGSAASDDLAVALVVGGFAHAIAWARQRTYLPADELAAFDGPFSTILRRAIERAQWFAAASGS